MCPSQLSDRKTGNEKEKLLQEQIRLMKKTQWQKDAERTRERAVLQ